MGRLALRPVTDVVGVVKSVAGFGSPGEGPSASVSFSHWREVGGEIERGSLYVRLPECDEERLRALRRELPTHHVGRIRVRLDSQWDEPPEYVSATLNALFVESLQPGDEDPELEDYARRLRAEEQDMPLGTPRFDASWLVFEFLARFVPRPDLSAVQLGAPLPDAPWTARPPATDEEPPTPGQEIFERQCQNGLTTVTVVKGRVGAVKYDFDTYRGSGVLRMRKLQTLISAHGEQEGTLHRILDNQHGAMFYTNHSRSCRAAYFYNSDRLMVRAAWCAES